MLSTNRHKDLFHSFLPQNIIARKRNCTFAQIMVLEYFTFSCFQTLHLLTAIGSVEAPAKTSKYPHGNPTKMNQHTKRNKIQNFNACKLLICCNDYSSPRPCM